MAAYTQFGYGGGYPSATQLLSTSSAQSPQTGDTPTAQSTISSANAPALSPPVDCHTNPDASSGALSPDVLSQNSNTGVAPSAPPNNANDSHTSAAGGSCCENGRPIMTDPVSGQTVCSCQYDSARLALSSYSRLPAGSVSVYGTPYPSTDQNPYQSIGVDSSAFYSPLSNPYALKDSGTGTEMTAWTSAGLQPTTGYYSYDPMSAYGYGASYDLAARRKNATRESTATLKAWLNEHKKNPYPTKGEKIMLAIITKMTLTQVSTWFANARRRLKKENKMTWEPKNRTDDDDDAMVSEDEKDKDDMEAEKVTQGGAIHPGNVGLGGVTGDHRKEHDKDEDDLTEEDQKPLSHPNDLRGSLGFPGAGYYSGAVGNQPHGYHPYHHQHPAYYQQQHAMLAAGYPSGNPNPNLNANHSNKNEISDPKNQLSRDCGVPIPATKPKIWSLADTVACKTPPPVTAYLGHQQQQQQHLPVQQEQHMNGSSMMPQQQQRTQHMMSNCATTPYSRAPTTAYGGFLGATAQQLHTTNNTPYNSLSTNSTIHNNSSDTHTPTTPITTANHLTQLQPQQQPPSRLPMQHPHAVSQRGMGFPEAQPDTPPQTPPNMKVPSVAANLLLLTASEVPTTAICRSSSVRGSYGDGSGLHYANYGTRFSEYSPRDECSSGSSSCSSGSSSQLQQMEVTFKPFSSQPISVAGFVPV